MYDLMIKRKQGVSLILLISMIFCFVGCGKDDKEMTQIDESVLVYVDALGNEIVFTEQEQKDIAEGTKKVAVLSGSFAEIWSLAGGKLSCVTEDAYDAGRQINLEDTTVNAGTVKDPNLEILLASGIEIAILSADMESQLALRDKLEDMGIRTIYHSVETFRDYLEVLEFYTELTEREDCYEKYGESLKGAIDTQIARQDDSHPTVLFLRAYSTGVKAKGSDSMTGIMLKELGCINIADEEERLIGDLSIEIILEKDPDYIFVTVMGSDEEAGLESVKMLLADNPVWRELKAVREDHYYVLPSNLFHNKPNQRWEESYHMLADILYPEQEAS